jgi:hypothetical protein
MLISYRVHRCDLLLALAHYNPEWNTVELW